MAQNMKIASDCVDVAVSSRLELISNLTQALNLADDGGYEIVGVHISQALELLRESAGAILPQAS